MRGALTISKRPAAKKTPDATESLTKQHGHEDVYDFHESDNEVEIAPVPVSACLHCSSLCVHEAESRSSG